MRKEDARKLKDQDVLVKVAIVNGEKQWYVARRDSATRCHEGKLAMKVEVNGNMVQVPFEDIRYLSERPLIEEEERIAKEKEKEFAKEYIIKDLSREKERFLQYKAEFIKKFETNPEYTIQWDAGSMVESQFNYVTSDQILKAIKSHPELKIHEILAEELDDLIRQHLNWDAANSTSKWSNSCEESKATARRRFIEQLRNHMQYVKRLDV